MIMKPEQASEGPINRTGRRGRDTIPFTPAETRLGTLSARVNATHAEYLSIAKQLDGSLIRMIYQGKPFIYPYLTVRRELPKALADVQKSNESNPNPAFDQKGLETFEDHNVFSHRGGGLFVKGSTLTEVEQMALAGGVLKPEDMARITRTIARGFKANPSMVRVSMAFLAAQKFARPELNLVVPDVLQALDARLTAYFDYFTGIMDNPGSTNSQILYLTGTMAFGAPFFPEGLYAYLPARLGITPSSTLKLFSNFLQLPPVLMEKQLAVLDRKIGMAIRPNNLPEDLSIYQHYNPGIDSKASKILGDYYGPRTGEQSQAHENMAGLSARLELYRRTFYSATRAAIEKPSKNSPDRVALVLPEHYVTSKVAVTTQYPNTMMFILQFPDDQTHLTLELGKKLYGLPTRLVTEQPHIGELIMNDLLPPLLAQLKSRYPNIEGREVIRVRRDTPSSVATEPVAIYAPPVRELSKRTRKLFSPIMELIAGPIPPTAQEEESKPGNYVPHTRDQIVAMVGKGAQDKVVDKIMQAIKDFEYGRGKAEKVAHIPGLWEVKSGRYRIILSPGKGNVYNIAALGLRKDLQKMLSNM